MSAFNSDALLDRFGEVDSCIGYGSGVIPQAESKPNPQLDFIIGVEDAEIWHRENMKHHPEDYGCLIRSLGPRVAAMIQRTGAGIFYNCLIDFEDEYGAKKIKVGVVESKTLLADLKEWNSLFIAGRTHKPIKILKSDSDFEKAISINREYALKVALILLGGEFTEQELFEEIARISYRGDVRLDDPEKVKNIVSANVEAFRQIYLPLLETCDLAMNKCVEDGHSLFDKIDFLIKDGVEPSLPSGILKSIQKRIQAEDEFGPVIKKHLKNLVRNSGFSQVIKGAITTDPHKTLAYGAEKIRKWIMGKDRIKQMSINQ